MMVPALAALVQTEVMPEPRWVGHPDADLLLRPSLEGAWRSTEGFGPWPPGAWRVYLHTNAGGFESATGAPPARAAAWIGATLHLRPWDQLKRRDVGMILRHELTHRRLGPLGLSRWEEEARCLWAETHVRPPETWPEAPPEAVRRALDRALERGGTQHQAWAYGALRAWLEGRVLPPEPARNRAVPEEWEPVADSENRPAAFSGVRVVWPPERMPQRLVANGQVLSPSRIHRWEGRVLFGSEAPVRRLEGPVEARWTGTGWELSWMTSPEQWIAAAVHGELGESAPAEAQRALAAVLDRWLVGHPLGHHPDGSLCPLTHCAVVKGLPGPRSRAATGRRPALDLDPRWAFFTGSSGGVGLSPRAIWGQGPDVPAGSVAVPGDRWLRWERTFTAAEVNQLKQAVRPGCLPGQQCLFLGASGPFSTEALRLAAGRMLGWTRWPSNACQVMEAPEGGMRLEGNGWGHNAGLCLTSAVVWARAGLTAEAILDRTFGAWTRGGKQP